MGQMPAAWRPNDFEMGSATVDTSNYGGGLGWALTGGMSNRQAHRHPNAVSDERSVHGGWATCQMTHRFCVIAIENLRGLNYGA
jgi:hypothetical protein